MGEPPGHPTVFISYSHRDEDWKDRVVGHLKVLEIDGELAVWDDERIAAGDGWRPEIEAAMRRAAVALLLISKDFLTSDFILGTEVPLLLQRRQTEGLRVIPVFVHPCAWEGVDWLAALQGRPCNGRALSEGRKPQTEKHLAELAREIRDLLVEGVAAKGPGARPAPATDPHEEASGAHPTRELRQMTVVCCELVGTEGPSGPVQEFDPEMLEELMLELRDAADRVTKRYGGQLGSVLGDDRVQIYFGYPTAHEDNAQRAVRAALELADEVARMSAESDAGRPLSLTLRVGIHTGSAVVTLLPQSQEPMTLGSTLELATDLLSLTEPGQVMVSPATCALIRKSFVVEALPPVRIGGRAPSSPCRVLEALGSPEESAVGRLPLVGREGEMELLLSRWHLARQGKGQVVLISGEAGIGKSRLLLALRERLEQGPVQWQSCFGSPYTQGSPLQPILGLLRQVLLWPGEDSPLAQLASSLRDIGLEDAVPLFAPLLDLPLDERYPAPNLSPERQREKTLEALVTLVLQMAERQPLVLLIEDLHWLDPTTLECLEQLIDQAASVPFLLLLTMRLHTLEGQWAPRSHLTQITLTSLSSAEAAMLVDQVVREQALPAELRQQIVARTDGVPLFLEELTKTVVESREAGERQLPATLRDSLAARLDRLGPAKEVAQIAAVIGRVFTFELLAAVCSCEEAWLQRELQRLVQAELVYRKGFGARAKYLFKHALVQDAAYESLLKRERQKIHRRIAEKLEERFPETAETTPEILAHHYTEAGLSERAIDFWGRAGELASRRFAIAEAISHLDRALGLLQCLPESPERDRRELRIQTARAAAIITGPGYLEPEVEQTFARAEVLAERLAEAQERFWAVLGLHTYHVLFGNLPQALELAERLLRIAESEQRPVLLSIAWFSLGVYHFYQSDYARALAELERAYELAPPDDDSYRVRTGSDLRVLALVFASSCLGHLGQLDSALQRIQHAITLARELGCPFTLVTACFHTALLAQALRDPETVRRAAREAYDLAMEMRFSYWHWQCSLLIAWAELVAPVGGPSAIELGDSDSAQIAQHGGCGMAFFFTLYAEILILQGRSEDAWRTLEEGLHLTQARGALVWVEEIYRLQGEILLEADNPAEAERRLQTALEQARRNGSRFLELRAALSLGRLWKSQGRTQAARDLVAQSLQGFTSEFESRDMQEAQAFLGLESHTGIAE